MRKSMLCFWETNTCLIFFTSLASALALTGRSLGFIILNSIIEKIPPPIGDHQAPLQAMIFDSVYNTFRGVEAYF